MIGEEENKRRRNKSFIPSALMVGLVMLFAALSTNSYDRLLIVVTFGATSVGIITAINMRLVGKWYSCEEWMELAKGD